MRPYLAIIVAMLLLGCSRKASPSPITESVSESLQAEIARIEPQLLFCDGGFAFPRPNNEDGRPNCDVGDGMHYTGILTSALNWDNYAPMLQFIRESVAPDGQLFRAPSYLRAKDPIDAFSRDQWVGFLHYLVATRDTVLAKQAIDYVKSHNDRLCPNATDNRCVMTLEMKALTDDVYTWLGFSRVYNVNRWLVEQATILEGKTAPIGYQMHLVAQKVYLLALTANLTNNYAKAADWLVRRQPNNLLFQYMYALTHGNDINRYNWVAAVLLNCMQKWEKPSDSWTFSQDRTDSACSLTASGHDYVWLGKLLLSKAPVIEMKPDAEPIPE